VHNQPALYPAATDRYYRREQRKAASHRAAQKAGAGHPDRHADEPDCPHIGVKPQ
jgi:hypothetical protein